MDADGELAVARALLRTHREAAAFVPLEGAQRPGDLDQAYRIQDAFCDLLHDAGAGAAIGYKIALTSRAMQEMIGIGQPLYGRIFDSRLRRGPAEPALADFGHLGVECELAVRLAGPPEPVAGVVDRQAVARAVAALAPAFELIDDRHADYRRIDALSLVADNCWNAGVVLGPETPFDGGLGFVDARAALTLGGALIDEGRAGDAMGHPFDAVAWLAEALARHGRRLEAGSLVMTGSVVRTQFPSRGDHLGFAIEGLGAVELRLH